MALTQKQWQRRALKAEEELKMVRNLRQFDKDQEMQAARENAALRVALREIQDSSNWANEVIAETL